jgi:hypothetical protein
MAVKRNQIVMELELKRRAQAKAAQQGISLAEYMRRVIAADLGLPRDGSEPGNTAATRP